MSQTKRSHKNRITKDEAMSYVSPWGPIGFITYKRTYARRLDSERVDSPTENFYQTIERGIEAADVQLQCNFTEEEKNSLRYYLLSLKGFTAGRYMWQAGTPTVDKLGAASFQNCWFVTVDDPIEPFVFVCDQLMLGGGVGYNIQKENVFQIPKVKKNVVIKQQETNDADFIVPDSREGWVSLLRKVLKAYFVTGKGFTYSTVCVRGKGTPIKGFGGIASGPQELCKGIENICKILDKRAGKKVNPIDCLDIMNIIGAIVISGNVRRSAQIALGDYEDMSFVNAKRWDLGNIPNWRCNSNNTVVCNNIEHLPEKFWDGYKGSGEPYGLFNAKLSQTQGRLGEKISDPDVAGTNPCGEISLASYEACNLAELNLPSFSSYEEIEECAFLLYRIQKHITLLPYHWEESQKIVDKNHRLGLGVTGYLQASEEQKQWLPKLYKALRKYDNEYSKKIGVRPSIKLTTVKPSGTLSLLPGVTAGAHPGIYRYFIRRIRMASTDPLVEVCRNNGYKIEFVKNFDGTEDHNTVVVEFPCTTPESTPLASQMSAIDQLEIVKRLQTDWSDNAVSVTVYYRIEELDAIRKWLEENYNNSIKSVSFLLHRDHGFIQAPYQEITEEEYKELISKVTPITAVDDKGVQSFLDNLECAGGMCPIK